MCSDAERMWQHGAGSIRARHVVDNDAAILFNDARRIMSGVAHSAIGDTRGWDRPPMPLGSHPAAWA